MHTVYRSYKIALIAQVSFILEKHYTLIRNCLDDLGDLWTDEEYEKSAFKSSTMGVFRMSTQFNTVILH